MAACASCGAQNEERARFCLECGSPLEAARPSESRRIVTVLFNDVVGSTALGEALDPAAQLEERMAAVAGQSG